MSAPVVRTDGSSFERVVEALEAAGAVQRVDPHRRHADALCPAHDDGRHGSLTVDWTERADKGGMVLLSCHGAGCDWRDVLRAVGLSGADAFDTDRAGYDRRPAPSPRGSRPAGAKAKPIAGRSGKQRPMPPVEVEYPYCDADGAVLATFRRHEGKALFTWQPSMPKPCPWFLLPDLVAAVAAGQPVHIAEGEKDALAVRDAGAAATSLPNGTCTTQQGKLKDDLVTTEHLERLRGADVVIWADRDGPDKKNPARGYQGYRHAMALRDLLAGTVASVRVVEAVAGKDAADHLAAGHGLDDAVEITPERQVPDAVLQRWGIALTGGAAAPASSEEEAAGDDGDNVVRFPGSAGPPRKGGGGGGTDRDEPKQEVYVRDRFELFDGPNGPALVQRKEDKDTITRVELLNADARILRHVIRDMGEAQEAGEQVDLEVTKDGHSHVIRSLKWEDFENPLKWTGRVPLPLTFPRGQGRGKLVNAIRQRSGVVPVETSYGLLGWREINGEWAYLHAGGAIGQHGSIPGTRVEVSPRLQSFSLPDPPERDELRTAYDAVIALADHLPHRIAYPLIAAGARAVLGDCRSSVYCLGRTATYKSGVTALVQQMWDKTARYDKLPVGAGEGAATGPALEQILYEAGHSVLVLDDLAPDRGASRSAARGAEILRTSGNGTAKLRSNRESTGTRPDKLPRALPIITAEDQPTVQSAERRALLLKFHPGEVTYDALLALSERWMIEARRGIISALARSAAGRMPLKDWLEEQRAHWAGHLGEGYDSGDGLVAGRLNAVADLLIGIRALLATVVEAGAVSREEAQQRWHEAWVAHRELLEQQFALTDRRSLVERLADLVRTALVSGRGHLAAPTGSAPPSATALGWDGDGLTTMEARARGACMGWTDGSTIWLHPGSAFAAAEAEGRAQSDPLDVTQRALKDAVVEAYPEACEPAKNGQRPRERRRDLAGARQRVWALPYAWLYPDEDPGSGDDGGGTGTTPPLPDLLTPPAGAEQAPGPDEQAASAETPDEPDKTTQKPAQKRKRADQRRPEDRYRAAAVVCDTSGAYLAAPAAGEAAPLPATVGTLQEFVDWAYGLNLGVHRPGGRASRNNGARDDAGQLVIMPDLAKKLGFPVKRPDPKNPPAAVKRLLKSLQSAGWVVAKRGLQSYTQIWPSSGGRGLAVVLPGWRRDEPFYADVDDAALMAYRITLWVGLVGMQMVNGVPATGAELLKQLRAYSNYPLNTKVHEVPPPGSGKEDKPLEDSEWTQWRMPTAEEQDAYEYVIGVDINADYCSAAASVVVGHGEPTHQSGPLHLPENLPKAPGYWLIDPPRRPGALDERLPDLWQPSLYDEATGPRWVATPWLAMLREAGYEIKTAREAWVYPNPGCHLQVWAHKLRDAVYSLRADLDASADPDAEHVLASLKLAYSGGIGMLGSSRYRTDTPLWLPHTRHSVIGLAMANRWRKARATGEATGLYPVGIVRDTLYYPASGPDLTAVPQVKGGFRHQDGPYRIGRSKLAGAATMTDFISAIQEPDKDARREALENLWHAPGERSE